jgi:hypothetical protein
MGKKGFKPEFAPDYKTLAKNQPHQISHKLYAHYVDHILYDHPYRATKK